VCTFSAVLTKDGHTVEFQKTDDRNAVELMVNGELVFKCDITELDYGTMLYFSIFVSFL